MLNVKLEFVKYYHDQRVCVLHAAAVAEPHGRLN